MALKLDNIKPEAVLIGLGLVGVLWLLTRGAAQTGKDIGGAVVGAAEGVAVGAVEAIGGLVGIPETDAAKCAAAKASGSLWEQSLYCPAADFFGVVLTEAGKGAADVVAGKSPVLRYAGPLGSVWVGVTEAAKEVAEFFKGK